MGLRGDLINPSVAGTFDDGSFVVTDARFDPGDVTGDWQQLQTTVVRYSSEGGPLNEWLVFAEGGIPMATLSISIDLRLLDIRGDRVLAVFTVDLGVEYLSVFRIESKEGPRRALGRNWGGRKVTAPVENRSGRRRTSIVRSIACRSASPRTSRRFST